MKAASELIRMYQALELPEEKRREWLEEACAGYRNEMPNDRLGQSSLYGLLGEACFAAGDAEQAEAAYIKAKEILEQKVATRKKVGCGYQEIEKDFTDAPEYAVILEKIAGIRKMPEKS